MHYTNAFIRGKKAPFRGVFKYKDTSGEWRQTVRTLKAQGIAEAKRELAELRLELEDEHEREVEVAKATMTVDEYLETYISNLDRTRSLERSTINGYRSYAKYVSNGLGRVRLSQLNAAQVQAWEAKLLKDGLSSVSVRKAHVLLKSACEHAVQTDLIPKNPLVSVKPPKLEAPMPNALDDRRRRALLTYLDAAAETPFNLAVLMELCTGMREGELCGLRWADVDLRGRTLWVRRSVARDNGKYYVKQPKTRSSIRDVPIPRVLAAKLKARRDAQETELIVAGITPSDERMAQMYVLGGVDGSYMKPHGLWRPWKELADSMGLVGTQGRRPTFHDLRHTFATFAITEGIDVKTVSSILGHANAAMTLNIYASADANAKQAAAATIDEVMERRLSPQEMGSFA